MSSIVSGIGNLIGSIVEIFQGILSTIFDVIRGAFVAVYQLFEGALNAVIGLLKGTFNLAEGVLGFIIGNIFIIGTIAAVFFGYQYIQQRQGKKPVTLTGK